MRKLFVVVSIVGLFLSIFTGCASKKIVVHRVETQKMGKHGIYYALPKTILKVVIPVKTITKEPGPYAAYAQELLGLEVGAVITTKSTTHALGTPQVKIGSIPDPDQIFFVEVSGGFLKKSAIGIELSETGIITKSVMEVEDKTFEFGVKAFETITGLIPKAFPFGAPELPPKKEEDRERAKAKLVAEKINDLRLKKEALISGDSQGVTGGLPVETLKLMLKELDELEERYLNFFTGATSISIETREFEFIPSRSETGKVLCGFSKTDGNITGYDPSDTNQEKLEIVITTPPNQLADIVEKVQAEEKKGEQGFYYRIPKIAAAEIKLDNTIILKEELLISQLGTVVALPADTGSRKVKYNISLYDSTGALKKLDINTEALDMEMLDKISSASQQFIEKIKESEDELAQLEKRRKILEEMQKIKELEKEINKE